MTETTDALLAAYWQLHPVEATHAGLRQFDAQVPDLSTEGWQAKRDWRQRARRQLAAHPSSAADGLDGRVLLGEVARQEIVVEEWEWPRRAPALYLDQALNGLQYVLARPAPESPAEALERRLAAVPLLLEQGRRQLRGELVPLEFVEIALVGTAGAHQVLDGLPVPADAAHRAVDEFERFLRQELQPHGSFALGRESFERLLREVHGVELSADDLNEHGRTLVDALLAELGADWRDQVAAFKADHPDREDLLPTYADEASRARRFVEEHGLVRIPDGEQFEVRPTAPYLRATTPLGHFEMAPPFSATDNLGILYITPVDAQLPAARRAELLEAHCRTAIRAICLHETFPGHHVQLWHAKLRASPIRRQFPSPLYTEGWALYCEELMEEAGYFDAPGLRLWRIKNALWRAVRLMVDVGLHCGGLTLEAAAQLLVRFGGLEPRTARGEALRYTTSPTQPSSYVLGRDRIVELRRLAEQQPGFSRAAFHEWLLGYSSVSPFLIPLQAAQALTSSPPPPVPSPEDRGRGTGGGG